MNAFLTGSQAYGIPTHLSDVDLVILTDEANLARLQRLADKTWEPVSTQKYADALGSTPLRFGNLNLIVCTNIITFGVWMRATDELSARPVPTDRSEAVGYHQQLRRHFGINREAPKPNEVQTVSV